MANRKRKKDLQNITQKTKNRAKQTPLQSEDELGFCIAFFKCGSLYWSYCWF